MFVKGRGFNSHSVHFFTFRCVERGGGIDFWEPGLVVVGELLKFGLSNFMRPLENHDGVMYY
jgi:hypothetical protein